MNMYGGGKKGKKKGQFTSLTEHDSGSERMYANWLFFKSFSLLKLVVKTLMSPPHLEAGTPSLMAIIYQKDR